MVREKTTEIECGIFQAAGIFLRQGMMDCAPVHRKMCEDAFPERENTEIPQRG